MRKQTAGRCGSFFLNLTAVMLIGGMILVSGCGHTPEPGTSVQTLENTQLFYSVPREKTTEAPISPDSTPLLKDDTIPKENDPPYRSGEPPPPLGGDADYLISPHDVIEITVLGEDDLSLTVRVSAKGFISFPLLGEVRALGYTPLQFERRLEYLLEKDFLVSPSVNIIIREYSTISVLGQVKKPGAYEIKGRLTVTQAIALAGGLTKIASPNGTKVIRKSNGSEEIIPIRLKDIMGDGDLSQDISLKPGDLIVIPESFF